VDVAHKDLDKFPRRAVLKNKPIQLSAATINWGRSSPPSDQVSQPNDQPSLDQGGLWPQNIVHVSQRQSHEPTEQWN